MQFKNHIALVPLDVCNPLKITCKICCSSFLGECSCLSSDSQKRVLTKLRTTYISSAAFRVWWVRLEVPETFLGVWKVKTTYKIILRPFWIFWYQHTDTTPFCNIICRSSGRCTYGALGATTVMASETADILAWTKTVAPNYTNSHCILYHQVLTV